MHDDNYGGDGKVRSEKGKMFYQVFFLFKIWFDLKMSGNDVMDVGTKFICLLNKNTEIFCKDNINNTEKDLTEGYNMLLNIKSMAPGDRKLLSIGYNFNFWKVLSFITKEVKCSIKDDNACLSK